MAETLVAESNMQLCSLHVSWQVASVSMSHCFAGSEPSRTPWVVVLPVKTEVRAAWSNGFECCAGLHDFQQLVHHAHNRALSPAAHSPLQHTIPAAHQIATSNNSRFYVYDMHCRVAQRSDKLRYSRQSGPLWHLCDVTVFCVPSYVPPHTTTVQGIAPF